MKYEKLSAEEKKLVSIIPKKYLNYYEPTPLNLGFYKFYKKILPVKFDLRNVNSNNYAPDVRDQGNFGLCWAFSTNSALESYMKIKKMGNFNFSERQLDYATANANEALIEETFNPYALENHYYYSRGLTKGGNNEIVSILWLSGISPVLEDNYVPYNTTAPQSLNSTLSMEKSQYSVTDTINYKALNLKYLKGEYSKSEIKEIVNQ